MSFLRRVIREARAPRRPPPADWSPSKHEGPAPPALPSAPLAPPAPGDGTPLGPPDGTRTPVMIEPAPTHPPRVPPHEAKPRVAAPDAAARPIEKTPVAGRSAELDVDDAIERAPAPEQSVAPISTGPPRRRPAATRGEPRAPIAEPVEASVTTSLPRLDGGPEPPRVTKTIDAVDDRPSPPADEIGETARHDVVAIEETTRANQREVHPAVPAVVTPDRAAPPEPHAPFIGAEAGPGAPTATPAPTEPRVHIGRLDVYVTAPEAPHRRPSTGADDLAQRLYLRGL